MNAIIDTGLSPLIVPPKEKVVLALRAVVPPHCVLSRDEETRPYECDGLSLYRSLPMAVVLPETEAQVQNILRVCKRLTVPVVARGAGTGLSGGAMPHAQGV
jgi:glycolate oxidase